LDYDVAVIGASSAGLYTAALLARKGVNAALFEREREIDPPRRTYIITPGLERVMGEIPSGWIKHQIPTLEVESKGEGARIPLADDDLILERNEIRKTLAERAERAGADLHLGLSFVRFEEAGGEVQLVFEDQEGEENAITAGTVVGADGVSSSVTRAAGISPPPVVPLLQAEIHLPVGWPRGLTKVWFDVVETRYFFWLIPESDSRAVVGLIGEPGRDIQATLDRFLERHSFRPLGMQSGRAAMHHPRMRPWGRVGELDVLLVGDAAGQVKVTTVGGTVTGFWGARAAVEAVTTGVKYHQALRPLKRELDLHWWIRSQLECLNNSGYDRLVSCLSPRVIDFLSENDRDSMKGHFWKLPFLQPRFLPLGLRVLFQPPLYDPLPFPGEDG